MDVISTDIQYTMTRGGSACAMHYYNGKLVACQATVDMERFLRWIIQSEVDKEVQALHKAVLQEMIERWWTSPQAWGLRGTFNQELYDKFLKARRFK